ncbi:MAG: trigger factor [Candidatus Nomurabacteria bacterium]|jgi:trigger factor|nr:trigger factor [Candidatus Nomurabacteria bacterium]
MKHTRKDLSESKIEYKVELNEEEVKKHHDAATKKLARDVKVAGFRAGHVPLEVATKHIDPVKLADEAVNNAVNTALIELIQAEKLRLLDRPDISVTKFVPAQVLEFTAVIEIVPQIKLADPAKLKAKKEKVEIGDKEINDVLERLQKNDKEKAEAKREAKDGDEAIIDFTGLKDGVEFDGGKATDYPLTLGSKSFIPGFEDAIIGHKAGDEFDIPLTFPKDYGAKDLAGKDVIFKIVLKKVNEVKLPELDDKFAAKISPEFKKLDDLKKDIKSELTARAEQETQKKFEDDLLDELAEKSKVTVPEILINDQLEASERNFTANLMYQGVSLDQYLEMNKFKTKEEWIEKELKPASEKMVRRSMVLAQLVDEWKISASTEEIEAKQAELLAQYNDPKIKSQFANDEAKSRIEQKLISDKTLQKLAELNSK